MPYAVLIGQRDAVFPVLIGKLLRDVIFTARQKARYGVMPAHQRNNLVVSRPRPAVGIVRAKMQAVDCRACLAV